MSIKLIALDLDGTTLNRNGRLTDRTKQALEAAIRQGVHVVIATGRTFSAVPDEVKAIEGIEYILSSNGAEIRNLQEDACIYSNYISPEAVDRAVAELKKHDFMLEVFVGGIAYTDKANYELAKQGGLPYRNSQYVVDTRNPVEDIIGFTLEHRDSIENININFDNQQDRAAMREILKQLPDITLTTSFDHNLEIGGATTSKASALKALGNILGVSGDEIMACGDSPNDGAMMSVAGLPVAVGNAKPEIKEMAAYVTDTNDNDGVAKAIERFVLNKMNIKKLNRDFTVCKLADYSQVDLSAEYCFTGRSDEENSLVCLTEDTPSETLEREDGWRAFRIEGVLDFSLIGILAGIAGALADEKIGIFVVSTFNTDYILVKKENEQKALDRLQQEGYSICD